MHYQLLFCALTSLIFIPLLPAEDKNKVTPYTICKEGIIGGIAGGIEPLATQPIINVKILSQQGKNFSDITHMIKNKPSALYTGLSANIVCSVPSIGAQILFDFAIKDTIPSNSIGSMIARNTIIGAFSALTCNSTELVIINQQYNNLSAYETIKKLYREQGVSVFGRGFVSKAARDSLFCMGFLTCYPYTKTIIENKLNSLNRAGRLNNLYSTTLASCLVGGPTALLSHPFDTASTLMQSDPSKKEFNGYMDIMKIMRQQGASVLYRGCASRALLIMLAIPIITEIKDRMKMVI